MADQERSECGQRIYAWNGEYESECVLPEEHDGDHFDGLSWYGAEGFTDHNHEGQP